MVVVFMELQSKLTYFGPRSTLRPALPKTSWGVAIAKADRFHQSRICFGPELGFPIRSQLSCSKLTLLTASSRLASRQETGKPVRTALIPPICHPTKSFSRGPDHAEAQCRPLPKGSSKRPLLTQLTVEAKM